jgi:hypothetical protein
MNILAIVRNLRAALMVARAYDARNQQINWTDADSSIPAGSLTEPLCNYRQSAITFRSAQRIAPLPNNSRTRRPWMSSQIQPPKPRNMAEPLTATIPDPELAKLEQMAQEHDRQASEEISALEPEVAQPAAAKETPKTEEPDNSEVETDKLDRPRDGLGRFTKKAGA